MAINIDFSSHKISLLHHKVFVSALAAQPDCALPVGVQAERQPKKIKSWDNH